MTPQEIQRTLDFIVRIQADSIVRAEKFEEKFELRHAKFQKDLDVLGKRIDDLAAEIRVAVKSQREYAREYAKSQRNYEKSQRNYEKRMRALEASDRRTRRRVEGIKDLMRLFSKRSDIHSRRLDRLERNGR